MMLIFFLLKLSTISMLSEKNIIDSNKYLLPIFLAVLLTDITYS